MMQASLINFGVKQYLQYRYRRIAMMHQQASKLQEDTYRRLVQRLTKTTIGQDYGIEARLPYSAYQRMLPIVTYEELYPYIERALAGEADVLYPGRHQYFAKSSGTTNARSKYIPVTDDMINDNFIGASWDAMAMVYYQRPETRIFADKSLLMGGTLEPYPGNHKITVGDVSAIMINIMPAIGRPFYTPDFDTAMLDDFEVKLNRMAEITAHERVAMFGGVPTWVLILMRRLLAKTGKSHMGEVWPHASLYMHGGVGFGPYRKQFDHLFPNGQLDYMEVYNASEGYIALQDDFTRDDMLLMVNNGIFYEFIQLSDYHAGHYDRAIPLQGITPGQDYVIVLSSCAGLWRYVPGDTVRFTSIKPYRLQVSGRTSQFINAFGEEVMVSNTDQAIDKVCREMNCIVRDYTVGPVYLAKDKKGCHQWLIEWEAMPESVEDFELALDQALRAINSDYDAKRSHNIALTSLQITSLPRGTFARWLKQRNRVSAQVKVPRLSNDRTIIDDLLTLERS